MTRLVCVHGPESSGKTTLSEQLAAHFGAALVAEYGRPYCEIHGLDLDSADLVAIGTTQSRLTSDAMARTDGLVITDTDALTTAAWSIMILGHVPVGVTDGQPKPDLYLLAGIDIPWVDDGMRYCPDPTDRRRFMTACERVLEGTGAPVVRISDSRAARLSLAIAAIEALQGAWVWTLRRPPPARPAPRRPGSAATR